MFTEPLYALDCRQSREQLIVEPPPLGCVKCEDLSEWVGTWAECHIQGDLMHPPPEDLTV